MSRVYEVRLVARGLGSRIDRVSAGTRDVAKRRARARAARERLAWAGASASIVRYVPESER